MSNKLNYHPEEPDPPVDQGLPPRPLPYGALPGNVQFARCAPVEGSPEPLIAFIYDSPDARVVSYWAESSFLQLAQRMQAFVAAPALTIADVADLEKLRDAGPFLEKP